MARATPYGTAELEEGHAAAHSAEQLLAATQAHLSQLELPGGVTVKDEDASA